jgi:voltage-gated potassium channel
VPGPNLIERRMSRFLREPASVRLAVGVIVAATAVVVVGGGVVIRLLDRDEYSSVWVGMWWALQTVTTVGYGDVTPKHVSGRVVGALVMLYGIGFLTITIAAITSTFVARAARERDLVAVKSDQQEHEQIQAGFDQLSGRLDEVERLLGELTEMTRSRQAHGGS